MYSDLMDNLSHLSPPMLNGRSRRSFWRRWRWPMLLVFVAGAICVWLYLATRNDAHLPGTVESYEITGTGMGLQLWRENSDAGGVFAKTNAGVWELVPGQEPRLDEFQSSSGERIELSVPLADGRVLHVGPMTLSIEDAGGVVADLAPNLISGMGGPYLVAETVTDDSLTFLLIDHRSAFGSPSPGLSGVYEILLADVVDEQIPIAPKRIQELSFPVLNAAVRDDREQWLVIESPYPNQAGPKKVEVSDGRLIEVPYVVYSAFYVNESSVILSCVNTSGGGSQGSFFAKLSIPTDGSSLVVEEERIQSSAGVTMPHIYGVSPSGRYAVVREGMRSADSKSWGAFQVNYERSSTRISLIDTQKWAIVASQLHDVKALRNSLPGSFSGAAFAADSKHLWVGVDPNRILLVDVQRWIEEGGVDPAAGPQRPVAPTF